MGFGLRLLGFRRGLGFGLRLLGFRLRLGFGLRVRRVSASEHGYASVGRHALRVRSRTRTRQSAVSCTVTAPALLVSRLEAGVPGNNFVSYGGRRLSPVCNVAPLS